MKGFSQNLNSQIPCLVQGERVVESYQTLVDILISALVIYVASIVYAKLVGLRSYAKISTPDFAMTVAIGSMIATTTLSKNVSAVEGCIGVAIIFALQYIFSKARQSAIPFTPWLENKPLLLMLRGEFMARNMKVCRVTKADLISKLRENNVKDLKSVNAVVFETTGDISIIHGHDVWEESFLDDVKGYEKE